jgi:hypothetical protein
MSDNIPERLENEAVNPVEIDNFDAQGHFIDQLICLGTAHLPRPPCHRDERYVAGKHFKTIYFCSCVLNCNNYHQVVDSLNQ